MLRADTDNIVLKRTNGVTVLLDFRTGVYFQINETAVLIWKTLVKSPVTRSGIVDEVMKKYSAKRDRVTKDVVRLLRDWKKSRLVVDCL